MEYEVPTSTWSGHSVQFAPNVYVDIGHLLDEKIVLFRNIYASQYTEESRGMLAEEGIRKHAKYRGTEVGIGQSEAFLMIRHVLSL